MKDGQPTAGIMIVSYFFDFEEEILKNKAIAKDMLKIKTKFELQEMLKQPDIEREYDFLETFSMLDESNTDFLISLLQHEAYGIRSMAAKGLGKIGSTKAVDALIEQITLLPHVGDQSFLLRALTCAKDPRAIPALQTLIEKGIGDQEGNNRVYTDGVLYDIRRLEENDLDRPLLVMDDDQLRFRFSLDQISSIYFLYEENTFSNNGYIYSPNPEPDGFRLDFDKKDFRKICDLLSDSDPNPPPSPRQRGRFLVIELFSGRHIALSIHHNKFNISGENRCGDHVGFSIYSIELSTFIDQAIRNR